jgi:hypothetical protein
MHLQVARLGESRRRFVQDVARRVATGQVQRQRHTGKKEPKGTSHDVFPPENRKAKRQTVMEIL